MLAEVVWPVYALGDFEIDLVRRELRILGSPIPVGGRAFEIIEVLAQSAGKLVTKDELMDRIWPGAIVMENTLHVHAAAVRKALGPHRGLLKTVSGRGYRLLGDWSARRPDAATPPVGLQKIRTPGETPGSNFPLVVTRLAGRSVAVQRVQDLVSAYRVVTLTGPGGIGKTSLAVKVGRRILGDFADGGWLVEFASLSDPHLVPSTVASVLGLKISGEISAESVARAIGEQNLLLVLDNCEHVIDAVATLTEMFVRLCPRTTLLATSREVLRVEGEHVYRVPPLEVPAVDAKDPGHILDHSAVELFIARAKMLDADFSSHPHDLPRIAAICRHLDGIPLAIEFAAARAATLGIDQVADGLNDRFSLLTSGRRTAVPRHRTLRATLDWSYDLLPEPERLLLRRLAVFPAGFTIDAATAVMSESGLDASAVMAGIANLVTKSLVALSQSEASKRWRLLETIRAYALEKLADSEANTAARHHAGYFRDYFAPPKSGFGVRLSHQEFARNGRDIDNVRAALDWCFSPMGDKTIGIQLTTAYAPVLLNLSLIGECHERCERALAGLGAAPTDARMRMQLQIALGIGMINTGDVERTRVVLAEALEAAEHLNDLDAQARVVLDLTTLHLTRGEYGEVQASAERLKQIGHQSGDPAVTFIANRFLGDALLAFGRFGEARLCFERALGSPAMPDDQPRAIWFHPGERAIARAQQARTLWMQGFVDQGLGQARASLEELEGTHHHVSFCRVLYYGLCRAALMTGDMETADRTIAQFIEAAILANTVFWESRGRFLEGKLLVERREFANAVVTLRSAFATSLRNGWRENYPEFMGTLAEAFAGLQRFDEARTAIDDAIARARQRGCGDLWYVPELLRIKGELLLQQDADRYCTAAEDCFDQAAQMAREQGALFWELRIALSLARLRVTHGRQNEARQILEPVYDRFTEGFGTADLRAARAMLDALEGGASVTS
jgi:predicted ATPase/DNA-binding winged helix-turn-helix (wHTH) protein